MIFVVLRNAKLKELKKNEIKAEKVYNFMENSSRIQSLRICKKLLWKATLFLGFLKELRGKGSNFVRNLRNADYKIFQN